MLDRHRPLEEALDALPSMEARDRAAAHRLAATALRRRGTIDAVLEPYLKRTPPDAVLHILRLGAAALLFLETPPHAAVATAVGLARIRKLDKFAGLVNAVLRRVSEHGASALEELDGPRLDTPPWLWSAWGRDARAIATRPPDGGAARPHAHARRRRCREGGRALPTGSVAFSGRHAGGRDRGLRGRPRLGAGRGRRRCPPGMLGAAPGEHVADLCARPPAAKRRSWRPQAPR